MAKLFTREQAREWLRENNLKDGKSIENAFVAEIKDVLQEALEEEMTTTLGYSKYDWDTTKPDGLPKRSLDVSRANREFGFKAQMPFYEGLKRTIAWYKNHRADTERQHGAGDHC